MKFYKQRISLNFVLYYILFFCISICCKEYYINDKNKEKEFKSQSTTLSSNPLINEEYFKSDDFDIKVKNINIIIGKVQTELLYEPYIYQFKFFETANESDLLVNFYPLDCKIKIAASNEVGNGIFIQNISNYEYDAFSVFIENETINSSYIKIKPLVNILNENNKKRTYHLVINSFYKDKPQLDLNEKEPTLIYFDSNLDTIKLSYKPQFEPVVFSFYIKERAKFEAKVMGDENNKKIIAYKDNLIVYPNTRVNDNNDIYLTIKKENNKNSTLIVKVSGISSNPSYLQKNILNLGFMPINSFNHYYYMEVFKGERGEIMMHNKINDALLIGGIIEKNKINETDIFNANGYYFFPRIISRSRFIYSNSAKRLIIEDFQLEPCENGCYLLITYNSLTTNLNNIEGIEYSLLARIWEEEEIKPQIVNIPLNEYILGSLDFYKNNYHYYTLYIPEGNNITIEIQGRNVHAFAKHGIIKINPFLKESLDIVPNSDSNMEIEDEKLIFTIGNKTLGLNSLEGQYISFLFFIYDNFLNSLPNYYKFRIIQANSNNQFIYPLDTNKGNVCRTSKKNDTIYACYFLMKNDYKEFNYNFFIYAYGNNEVNYNVWYIDDKETDYFSIDINYINKYKNEKKEKGYFPVPFKNDTEFIIIEIESNLTEILNVFFNFDSELLSSPSLDIYSYQIFYLKSTSIYIYFKNYLIFEPQFALIMNNTSGEGHIYLDQKNGADKKIYISNDNLLFFSITNNNTYINISSESSLFISLKIKNILDNKAIEELNYGENINEQNEIKAYYIKDIYGKGIDINFYLGFENNISDYYYFIIDGFSLPFDEIKYIENKDLKILNRDHYKGFSGIYDPKVKSGIIVFDTELENEVYNKDNYFLFCYSFKDIEHIPFDYFINSELFIESKANPKIIKKNKYIRGYFTLKSNTTQYNTYKIEIQKEEEKMNKAYILEFSSNYNNMELIFNDDFNYYEKRIKWGVQQYFISGKNLISDKEYYFKIKVNSSNIIYNPLNLYAANYIIKFSDYKNEKHQDFVKEKELKLDIVKKKVNDNTVYNFTFNLDKTYTNINNYYKYYYFFTIINKQLIYEDELLNTTAIIIYKNIYYIPYLNSIETYEPNKDYSFSFTDEVKGDYFMQIFIKINGQNDEETYYSTYIDLAQKEESNLKEKNKFLNIIIIILGSILLASILFVIFLFIHFKRKNESLKGKIETISFSTGIEDNSFDNINNNKSKSKNDDDYETTFI